jgi:hypothetical protein
MREANTSFDLERLIYQVNSALDDSDESASEILVRIAQLLKEHSIPVCLACCWARGSTSASGNKKPFEFEDYCLVMAGEFYNFNGKVKKDDIESSVGETLLDDYIRAVLDPGETQLSWDMDAIYRDTLYLTQETDQLLVHLVGQEVSLLQHAQLQGNIPHTAPKRASSRL